MEYLYQILMKFWGFFFGGPGYATTVTPNVLNCIEFLAMVTTIAVVMQFIMKPLFGFLPWNKKN